MHKRLVTRYAMRSAEAADENQLRVRGVFDELAETEPTVSATSSFGSQTTRSSTCRSTTIATTR